MPTAIRYKNYWHIRVEPESIRKRVTDYRKHDIGRKGHSYRLAGYVRGAGWKTLSFHIHKDEVEKRGNTLRGLTSPVIRTLALIRRNYGYIKVK